MATRREGDQEGPPPHAGSGRVAGRAQALPVRASAADCGILRQSGGTDVARRGGDDRAGRRVWVGRLPPVVQRPARRPAMMPALPPGRAQPQPKGARSAANGFTVFAPLVFPSLAMQRALTGRLLTAGLDDVMPIAPSPGRELYMDDLELEVEGVGRPVGEAVPFCARVAPGCSVFAEERDEDGRSWACPPCGQVVGSWDTLAAHFVAEHSRLSVCFCVLCGPADMFGSGFTSLTALFLHAREEHGHDDDEGDDGEDN